MQPCGEIFLLEEFLLTENDQNRLIFSHNLTSNET